MKRKELEEKTVVELKTLAKKQGITLKAKIKSDIIDEIISSKKKKPTPKVKKLKKKPKKVEKLLRKVKKTVEKPKKAKLPKKIKPPKEIKEKKEPTVEVKAKPYVVHPALPIVDLSPEISEDTVIALTLEPKKIFLYWELTKQTLKRHKGEPTLKVYDVTGIEELSHEGENANSSFDIGIPRIGSIYIDVMPERDFIIDVGVMQFGRFTKIARSNRVSTPVTAPLEGEKAVLPPRYYEFVPTGWYEKK